MDAAFSWAIENWRPPLGGRQAQLCQFRLPALMPYGPPSLIRRNAMYYTIIPYQQRKGKHLFREGCEISRENNSISNLGRANYIKLREKADFRTESLLVWKVFIVFAFRATG